MITITKSMLLKHYKRKDVQKVMIAEAKDREVGIRFSNGAFGKRPDILQYPKDILDLAMRGVASFHASEEHWMNPLQLGKHLKSNEVNDLRTGWDLILDIDCKELEYSKIAAHLIVSALQHHDVKSFGIKFSGNRGFHIGIPFKAFPKRIGEKETRTLFPEGPRRIAAYLKEMIREPLTELLLQKDNLSTLAIKTDNEISDIVKDTMFNPFAIVDIDTILISSRHLYRMIYSFNEKSGLVSIPVNHDEILSFKKESAEYNKITLTAPFIATPCDEGEATQLLMQAFDFKSEEEKKEYERKEFIASEDAIPEEFFPPCIHNIAKGLEDGKKRAVFILKNFLSSVGWSHDEIEAYIYKWNKTNKEQLREVIIKGQLSHHKKTNKIILPPNCDNKAYYQDLQICTPDNFCKRIKNPANYAILKQKIIAKQETKTKKKTIKEEKKNPTSQQDSPTPLQKN